MIEAPSLVGRVYEHYVEFEEIIAACRRRALRPRRATATPTRGCSSACAMTAVRVGLVLWHERGETEPLADVVAELFTILGNGLATAQVGSRARVDERGDPGTGHPPREMPHPNPHCVGPGVADVLRHHMVGLTGFEPAASSSRTRRATKLRHSPIAGPGRSRATSTGEHTGVGRAAPNRVRSAGAGSGASPRVGRRPGTACTARSRARPTRAARTTRDRRDASRRGAGGGPGRGRARGRSW